MARNVATQFRQRLLSAGTTALMAVGQLAIAPVLQSPLLAQTSSSHLQEASAPTDELPTLQEGSTGEQVLLLQRRLRQAGYDITSDGLFGPSTTDVVKQFQADYHQPSDGIVGSRTWSQLLSITDPLFRRAPLTTASETLPGFTELTPVRPERPPSPIWLIIMPLIPITGGCLSYFRHRLLNKR